MVLIFPSETQIYESASGSLESLFQKGKEDQRRRRGGIMVLQYKH